MCLDPNLTFLVSAYNVLLKVHSNHVKTIAMNGDRVSALMDYNIKDDRIVWFDPQKHKFILKSIQSTVDMSDEIEVVGQPNSLLLDWVHDLLYWIDIKSKTIKVLHFKDTESVYTVCDIKTENPRDLVINVVKGVLVWSNIGFEANLMQTHLDGSNQSVLYDNNRQAFHLTVDYQTQRYYFIDFNDHSLYSIDFDGNNETFILKSKELFDPIISIQVFNNDLYFMTYFFILRIPELDLQLNRAHVVYKIHRYPNYAYGEEFFMTNTIDIDRREFTSFKIMDPLLQPDVENVCQLSKCPQLCLPTSGQSYRCLLSDSMVHIKSDNNDINNNLIADNSQAIHYSMNTEKSVDRLSIVNTVFTALLFIALIIK